MKLVYSLFCRDVEAQLAFYQGLLKLPEATHSRSPIFRGLLGPGFMLGLHAPPAYGLLGLADRAGEARHAPVTSYATFELPLPADVDRLAQLASALGGRVVQGPFPTYYGQWQAVLADPEGHVLRLACTRLPQGVSAPVLDWRDPTLAACPGTPPLT